jgi:hypothetical protein
MGSECPQVLDRRRDLGRAGQPGDDDRIGDRVQGEHRHRLGGSPASSNSSRVLSRRAAASTRRPSNPSNPPRITYRSLQQIVERGREPERRSWRAARSGNVTIQATFHSADGREASQLVFLRSLPFQSGSRGCTSLVGVPGKSRQTILISLPDDQLDPGLAQVAVLVVGAVLAMLPFHRPSAPGGAVLKQAGLPAPLAPVSRDIRNCPSRSVRVLYRTVSVAVA